MCRSALPLRAHNLHLHLFSQNHSPEMGTRPPLRSSKSLITMLHKHRSNFEHWKKNEWEKQKGKKLFRPSCSVTVMRYIYRLCLAGQFPSQSTDGTIRNTLTSNVKCEKYEFQFIENSNQYTRTTKRNYFKFYRTWSQTTDTRLNVVCYVSHIKCTCRTLSFSLI